VLPQHQGDTAMTLSESAINEILFTLDNGDGSDLVRQLAELGMQGLIEAEATEVIGHFGSEGEVIGG
jgi:hypothetical protein